MSTHHGSADVGEELQPAGMVCQVVNRAQDRRDSDAHPKRSTCDVRRPPQRPRPPCGDVHEQWKHNVLRCSPDARFSATYMNTACSDTVRLYCLPQYSLL